MSEPQNNSDLVLIGRVVSVNFPKRRLRVRAETDHPERFCDMSTITVETAERQVKTFDIERVELRETEVAITLAGRYSAAEIAAAKKGRVLVRDEERYPLDEDEHYLDDLLGMRVVDASGRPLGRLEAVYRTVAHDIYEIGDRGTEPLLVPAVRERILSVDVANGVLTLDPDGLVEGADES